MISVCMATYNGETFIKSQIDSILSQLGPEDELIVSDDGSTDSTVDIIRHLNDERILVLKHQKAIHTEKYDRGHILVSENFENALKYAKGDIIFLSDQDDIWLPNRVKEMCRCLNNNDLVLCNFNIINSKDKLLRNGNTFTNPIKSTFLGNLWRMPFFGSAMAFRRNIIDICLPFPKGTIAHDNWIGLLAFTYGKVAYIEQPLHNYRRHDRNATKSVANPLWHKIKYRLLLAYNILKRKPK